MFGMIRRYVFNAGLAGLNDLMEYLERNGARDAEDAPRLLEERGGQQPAPGGDRPSERPVRNGKGKAS